MPIFVPGSDNDSDGPGRFPVKNKDNEKDNGTRNRKSFHRP